MLANVARGPWQLEAVVIRRYLGPRVLGGAPPRPEELWRDRSWRRSPRCERMQLLGGHAEIYETAQPNNQAIGA
jgi:hypothetical protein